jgi:hypothetical protein
MTKKIYYEKIGRRYKAVYEYDQTLMDAFPKGSHLVICYPGGQSTRYNVDPAYAPMIAAGRVAEDKICEAIRKASDLRPKRAPITEGQRQAWENLVKEFGEDARMLTMPSAREVADEAVKALIAESDKLLANPAVQLAYEHFQLVCKLTAEQGST